MGWRKFKEILASGVREEHFFILGIDIGNATSSMSYFDLNQLCAEIIDISGGYGKPSVPTVMQYISETKEWVFGEYAMAGRASESDKVFSALTEKLGAGDYVEVAGKPVSVSAILGLYLKELIGNCKNMNPRAEIAGIVVAVPSYLSEEARQDLAAVFKQAGYEKQLLGFWDDRECVFQRYYFDKAIRKETMLIIDFGARAVRGGIYEIAPGTEKDSADVECQSFLFEKGLGTKYLDRKVAALFMTLYAAHFGMTPEDIPLRQKEQIDLFAYQHKDMLFQKSLQSKPVKLYFNFAYPPFQETLHYDAIEKIIRPFRDRFRALIDDVLQKPTAGGKTLDRSDIDTVLCVGGGFEMLWAREAVLAAMKNAAVVFQRNSKGVVAEGASIIAAQELRATAGKKFNLTDRNRLDYDIGFKIMKDRKARFLPVVESNSFWWQEHPPKQFILMQSTEQSVQIELLKRFKDGTENAVQRLSLEGLPKRPRGATRMRVSLDFQSGDSVLAKIKDLGFGELFPAAAFEKEFLIDL